MVCKICMKKKLYKDLPYARNSVSKCQAQKALNKSLQLFPSVFFSVYEASSVVF